MSKSSLLSSVVTHNLFIFTLSSVLCSCAAHAPRRSINCAGVYKQTQQSVALKLDVIGKHSASAGLDPKVLATLTERGTIIALRHRELCEVYKGSPDFTPELYLRRARELDEFDLELSRLVDKAVKAGADAAPDRAGSDEAKASLKDLDASARALSKRIAAFDQTWQMKR